MKLLADALSSRAFDSVLTHALGQPYCAVMVEDKTNSVGVLQDGPQACVAFEQRLVQLKGFVVLTFYCRKLLRMALAH